MLAKALISEAGGGVECRGVVLAIARTDLHRHRAVLEERNGPGDYSVPVGRQRILRCLNSRRKHRAGKAVQFFILASTEEVLTAFV